MRDKIYEELCKICDELRGNLKQDKASKEFEDGQKIGLCSTEVRRLLRNEPDFTKRIVTPLKSNRTKRRSDVTQLRVTANYRLLLLRVKNRLLD